jgi:hypothetical protein
MDVVSFTTKYGRRDIFSNSPCLSCSLYRWGEKHLCHFFGSIYETNEWDGAGKAEITYISCYIIILLLLLFILSV